MQPTITHSRCGRDTPIIWEEDFLFHLVSTLTKHLMYKHYFWMAFSTTQSWSYHVEFRYADFIDN